MTFNNVPEAVGVSRAAAHTGLPLMVYFTLDRTSRLKPGSSLKHAIEATDAATGDARPDFYGINCSHPLECGACSRVRRLDQTDTCSSPERRDDGKRATLPDRSIGHLGAGDPAELGRQMGELARRYPHIDFGAGVVGRRKTRLAEIARSVREPLGALA
jgi:hypothetical protein